jgi:sugar lactone lactonase YvrE
MNYATDMALDTISVALATPMKLGESPFWHPDEQALYWIDIPGQAVHRLHVDSGAHRMWQMPAEPGCIARCAGGGVIVALRSGLAFLDTDSGELTPITDAPYDTTKMRFNDGRCDAAGRLWAGTLYEPRDQAAAPLYRVEHGKIIDSGRRATVSNGVAFTPDNRTLYHSDTTTHRIFACDFDLASGAIGEARLFQEFSTDKTHDYGGRPDGAAVDSEGAYWCAMFEGGRILRFSPAGELLREIRIPARCPTMIAFGGADLRTMYITTARNNRPNAELAQYPHSGCVLSLRVDVAGREEYAYLR